MILVIGTDIDPTSIYFIKKLKAKNIDFLFFNMKNLYSNTKLYNEYFIYNSKKYYYNSFSGVLNRASGTDINAIKTPEKYWRAIALEQLLYSFLNCKFTNVLNRCFYGISNNFKLLQISSLDLKLVKIPKYKILSNVNIEQSLKEDNVEYVVKSQSGIRSIAQKHNKDIFPESESTEPVLFQELIIGDNIRVHVVSGKCFPIRIKSDQIDYRYSTSTHFSVINIPDKIAQECILISKKLNLLFTGIDLIQQEKDFFLLEANPMPGWSYFEKEVKYDSISLRLIEILLGKVS